MDICRVCAAKLNGIKCHQCGTYIQSSQTREKNTQEPRDLLPETINPEPQEIPEAVPEQIEEKNIIQKAVSFAGSAINHAKNGFRDASIQTINKRLSICKNCDFYQDGSCKQCGCNLNVKVTWASESCPIGKWTTEIIGYSPRTCGECGKKKT